MGGSTSQEIQTEVRNSISTEITNATKNLNDIFNETINSTMQSIVNETENTISINTSGANELEFGDVSMSGNSKLTIKQRAAIAAQNAAIIQVMTDTKLLSDLSAKLAQNLQNSASNNNSATQSQNTLSELKKLDKDGGGVESMVRSVMGAISELGVSLTGSQSKSSQKTLIENKLGLKFSNITTNENKVRSAITNNSESLVKNITENKCNFNTSGFNKLKVKNIKLTDYADFNIDQDLNITAFNKCIISNMNTQGLISQITGITENTIKNATENTNKAEQEQKAITKITDETIKEASLLKDLTNLLEQLNPLNSLKNIIIWLAVILLIGGIVYSMSGSKDKDDDQDGGNYNDADTINMILIAIVGLFFLNTMISCR